MTRKKGLAMWSRFCVLFLMGVGISQAQGIQGRITLKGTPPPDVVIPSANTKDCHGGTIKTEFWSLGTNGGLGNVVVWVEGVPNEVKPEEPLPQVVIDQQGCRYTPHISAVQVKEKVVVKNSDPTLHNVRGSLVLRDKKNRVVFNLAQPVKGMKSEVSFSQPGLHSLECDVHPWMQAWVMVLESPFYAVTDEGGVYQLPKGLPAGEYEVKAWHERFLNPLSQKVILTDKMEDVNFEFVLESGKGHN
jgi:plastocyanin